VAEKGIGAPIVEGEVRRRRSAVCILFSVRDSNFCAQRDSIGLRRGFKSHKISSKSSRTSAVDAATLVFDYAVVSETS